MVAEELDTSRGPSYSREIVEYDRLLTQIRRNERLRTLYLAVFDMYAPDSTATPEQQQAALDSLFGGDASVFKDTLSGRTIPDYLQNQIEFYDSRIDGLTQQAFTVAPQLAQRDLFYVPFDDRPEQPSRGVPVRLGGQMFMVSPDTAASLAQRNYEFNSLSAGEAARLGQDMFFFNNLSARDVEGIAVQLRSADRLDDDLKFRIDDARAAGLRDERRIELQALGVQAQFAGLELTRRGQMVDALGQDFAFQISIGRMSYEEAAVRMETVDRALTQRREEREQLLQFAVRESSLRTVNGETVTRLPGAEQLAAILSQSTGQTFNVEDFDLPVGRIDPQQAGQDVIDAGAFESPIPGLLQGLQSTREAMAALLNAPVATSMVSDGATRMVTEGV